MPAVGLGHVRRLGGVPAHGAAPGMARHPPAPDEDLDRASAGTDVDLFADEAVRDAVVVAIELDVVVDAHLRLFPDGVLVRGCLLYTSDAADDLLCVDLGGR